MGRAWVELTIDERLSGDDSIGLDYDRVKVPGLSIVGGSVVMSVDGQSVECAVIKPVGMFRYRMAKATKNCKFSTRTEKRVTDDGFELTQQKFKS